MEGHSHKRRQASGSHLEIMVYVDQGVENDANQNGFNVTDYILSIINIVRYTLHHLILIALSCCCFFYY